MQCLDGEPVARGCASKEKMFHEQCEVHEMDEISEKFCYCSFNWCNSSHHLTVKGGQVVFRVNSIFISGCVTPTPCYGAFLNIHNQFL